VEKDRHTHEPKDETRLQISQHLYLEVLVYNKCTFKKTNLENYL